VTNSWLTAVWRKMAWLCLSWMAMPLAFVSLPLYVMLPHRYATAWGVPLASLGALLLTVRALDALLDPWLGARCDGWFAHGMPKVLERTGMLCGLLALGFAGLWLPDVGLGLLGLAVTPATVLPMAAVCLVLAYLGATCLNLTLQSWGTRLGGHTLQQSRIVAWREGLGLLGVVLASVLTPWLDAQALVVVLTLALALGGWLWRAAPFPVHPPHNGLGVSDSEISPMQRPVFRALLQVFVLNGIASAVPATLVMFFIQDQLQAPSGYEARYLGAYFVAAAVSLPLWLWVVRRVGLLRAWGMGMALAMGVFMWTVGLEAGDLLGFGVICALSGLALGADLVVPGALLTGVIQRAGDSGAREGRYLGWWQVATKLNLAVAAGLSLPALQLLGYTPGAHNASGLWALTLAYGVLPCGLKFLAAWRLWTLRHVLQEN
jgi:Na+/melibiose symporter-like transporter